RPAGQRASTPCVRRAAQQFPAIALVALADEVDERSLEIMERGAAPAPVKNRIDDRRVTRPRARRTGNADDRPRFENDLCLRAVLGNLGRRHAGEGSAVREEPAGDFAYRGE